MTIEHGIGKHYLNKKQGVCILLPLRLTVIICKKEAYYNKTFKGHSHLRFKCKMPNKSGRSLHYTHEQYALGVSQCGR